MNSPFRLEDHPRRPAPPLAPPPARYFEQLPHRVLARVPGTSEQASSWAWLQALSAPWRTALASVAVLGGFAATFLLSPTPTTPVSGSLAQVPQEELVQYLLAVDQRLTLTDLAELPATAAVATGTTESYLQASPDELQHALDALPADESYL